MTRNQKSRVLFCVTLALLLGVFAAGLWPFNFLPRNQVYWAAGEPGLYFQGYGQAYSARLWTPNGTNADASFTIILSLRPNDPPYPHFSPVFSLDGRSPETSLSIAQSGSDLVVVGSFVDREGNQFPRHLWMDDACRGSKRMLVSVTSGSGGTAVYWWNGILHVKTYPDLLPQRYSGRLLLGHAGDGNQPWRGDILGLAIYDRALGPEAMSTFYRTEQRGLSILQNAQAWYTFDEGSGMIIHSRTQTAPDLMVPTRFRLLHPTVLEFPHPIKSSDVTDTVVNIAGFVPFGFLLCTYMRTKHTSPQMAVLWTLVGGTLTSLAIELLQVFLPSRDSSLLDVINNVLGTGLGAIVALRLANNDRFNKLLQMCER